MLMFSKENKILGIPFQKKIMEKLMVSFFSTFCSIMKVMGENKITTIIRVKTRTS